MCWFDRRFGPNSQVDLFLFDDTIRASRQHHLTIVDFSSCNIGEGGICLAEAVHGSAPDISGKVNCSWISTLPCNNSLCSKL
jgi:hypothetical protein